MSGKPASVSTKSRARRILQKLKRSRPLAMVELQYRNPYQLLVATVLSAQCTDERVNRVTPELFRTYPSPSELAKADLHHLEHLIRTTGFFRSKAKHLIACANQLLVRFHGQVPATMEALKTLPGIGRKTANVLLGACFGKPAVVVDTHVKRVANRLQCTTSSDPARIEADLQALFPSTEWTEGSQQLLLHGRYVCLARKPKCHQCVLYEECSWKGKAPRC